MYSFVASLGYSTIEHARTFQDEVSFQLLQETPPTFGRSIRSPCMHKNLDIFVGKSSYFVALSWVKDHLLPH